MGLMIIGRYNGYLTMLNEFSKTYKNSLQYTGQIPKYIFNKPWVEALNQDLLIRYWKKCGINPLVVTQFGTQFVFYKSNYGIISIMIPPKLTEV